MGWMPAKLSSVALSSLAECDWLCPAGRAGAAFRTERTAIARRMVTSNIVEVFNPGLLVMPPAEYIRASGGCFKLVVNSQLCRQPAVRCRKANGEPWPWLSPPTIVCRARPASRQYLGQPTGPRALSPSADYARRAQR